LLRCARNDDLKSESCHRVLKTEIFGFWTFDTVADLGRDAAEDAAAAA